MPKIGMRTIKTAIAVAICITILQFFDGTTAFFAATAAIFSLQSNMATSWKLGFSRWIGTDIGAVIGFLFSFIPLTNPLVRTLVISFGIILIIYITTLIKQDLAVFIACLVFLAIMTNLKDGHPGTYALTRTLETGLGVIVSILVNKYIAPLKL